MYAPPPGSPSPMMSLRARLRPMGVGDILDETFRLYRENFMLFIATAAVLEVPVQIINLLLALAAPPPSLTAVNGVGDTQIQDYLSRLAQSGASTGVGAVLVALASVFITAALAFAISHRYLDRTVTVGQAYRATLNRLGSLLMAIIWIVLRYAGLVIGGAIVVTVLFVAIALFSKVLAAVVAVIVGLVCALAMIYLAVAWSLISQTIMLDNVTGRQATGRSRRLIQGHWWKALGLLVVAGLLVNILNWIPRLIVAAIIGTGVGTASTAILATGIVELITNALTWPIQIAALTLLFYDLKIRKEAFDLEAMVQQASLPTPAALQ